jgi:hypothetical protein
MDLGLVDRGLKWIHAAKNEEDELVSRHETVREFRRLGQVEVGAIRIFLGLCIGDPPSPAARS